MKYIVDERGIAVPVAQAAHQQRLPLLDGEHLVEGLPINVAIGMIVGMGDRAHCQRAAFGRFRLIEHRLIFPHRRLDGEVMVDPADPLQRIEHRAVHERIVGQVAV